MMSGGAPGRRGGVVERCGAVVFPSVDIGAGRYQQFQRVPAPAAHRHVQRSCAPGVASVWVTPGVQQCAEQLGPTHGAVKRGLATAASGVRIRSGSQQDFDQFGLPAARHRHSQGSVAAIVSHTRIRAGCDQRVQHRDAWRTSRESGGVVQGRRAVVGPRTRVGTGVHQDRDVFRSRDTVERRTSGVVARSHLGTGRDKHPE